MRLVCYLVDWMWSFMRLVCYLVDWMWLFMRLVCYLVDWMWLFMRLVCYLVDWMWLFMRLVSHSPEIWTLSSLVGLPDTVTNIITICPALDSFTAAFGSRRSVAGTLSPIELTYNVLNYVWKVFYFTVGVYQSQKSHIVSWYGLQQFFCK
jgi:hypothetical protein